MGKRILIVDDEESCAYFLSAMLEEEGHEIRTAARGSDAIKEGLKFRPEILITDWMLRETEDGLEVARQLYQDNPELRIVLISGMGFEQFEAASKRFARFKMIEKPVELERLLQAIAELE